MLRILHLEDCKEDAFLVQQALTAKGIKATILVAKTGPEFLFALAKGQYDLILVDNSVPGFGGPGALELVRKQAPETPVVCVSGAATEDRAFAALAAGATGYVLKDQLWQLVAVVRSEQEKLRLTRLNKGMAQLVAAIQELSLARKLDVIMKIVVRTARELTSADGATFVLEDGECCFYADEAAAAPLWKGKRFPMQACIGGWVMTNRQPVVLEDIHADPRIPVNAYRPAFVKSLAMVPILTTAPIGAIGSYWATQHVPTIGEVELLQSLANTTAAAMENVRVYGQLQQHVV